MANALIVLTSHTELGRTGRKTGFYFDEMAAPYWALTDAGHDVRIATIAGGSATPDPTSVTADGDNPPAVDRFRADPVAMAKLSDTPSVDAIDATNFDAVFLAGGHGTMFDFPDSDGLADLVSAIHAAGGVVGAVCHGPAGLVKATRTDGRPLVEGLRVNAFTDAEEAAVELTDEMPFLLETRLRALGAVFEASGVFEPHAVRDGRLVTGQNPASAGPVAALLLEAIAESHAVKAA
ncbi:MAG: type 1 glutamine amidotransferase domain-containing protein [Pseudomonadota bacterium]